MLTSIKEIIDKQDKFEKMQNEYFSERVNELNDLTIKSIALIEQLKELKEENEFLKKGIEEKNREIGNYKKNVKELKQQVATLKYQIKNVSEISYIIEKLIKYYVLNYEKQVDLMLDEINEVMILQNKYVTDDDLILIMYINYLRNKLDDSLLINEKMKQMYIANTRKEIKLLCLLNENIVTPELKNERNLFENFEMSLKQKIEKDIDNSILKLRTTYVKNKIIQIEQEFISKSSKNISRILSGEKISKEQEELLEFVSNTDFYIVEIEKKDVNSILYIAEFYGVLNEVLNRTAYLKNEATVNNNENILLKLIHEERKTVLNDTVKIPVKKYAFIKEKEIVNINKKVKNKVYNLIQDMFYDFSKYVYLV